MFLRNYKFLSKTFSPVSNGRFICLPTKILEVANRDGDGKEEDAATRLNSLLLSIVKDEKVATDVSNIQIPQARMKQRLKKSKEINIEKKKDLGRRIVDAAGVVAKEMEGNDKEIEAQLLHKLLYKDSSVKEEILKASSGNQSLTELLTKMEVEKDERTPQGEMPKEAFSRASQVKSLVGKRSFREKHIPKRDQKINLFNEKPLGIFDPNSIKGNGVVLKIWSACEDRERKLSVTHPPANYFEQMIDWTEKGIVWKFPINNEQGMDEESTVSFASHVLLESNLDGWCPSAGPIRHFMELVCVGLSRNHWLSASEKVQHILWYKEFFSQRSKLIKDLGAGEIHSSSDVSST